MTARRDELLELIELKRKIALRMVRRARAQDEDQRLYEVVGARIGALSGRPAAERKRKGRAA